MTLVLVVTFALILISQFVLFKNKPNPPKTNPTTQPAAQAVTQASAPPPAEGPVPAPRAKGKSPTAPPATASKTASSEVETVVENSLYRIVFTNKGAQVKSWVLKKYKDDQGRPLDLVNPATAAFGSPLGLYTYDDNLRNQVNSALYVTSAGGDLAAPAELTYEYSESGITVRKTFRFDDTYVVAMETSLTQNAKPVQAYPMWPAGFGDQNGPPAYAASRIDYEANDKVERLAAKKVSGGNTLRGPFNWAGPAGPVFRRHLPAGRSEHLSDGHLPARDHAAQRSGQARSQ